KIDKSSLFDVPVIVGPSISSLPKAKSISGGSTSKLPSLRTVKVQRSSARDNMLVDVNLLAESTLSHIKHKKKRTLPLEEYSTLSYPSRNKKPRWGNLGFMGGDFNAIMSNSEKKRGCLRHVGNHCLLLMDVLGSECNKKKRFFVDSRWVSCEGFTEIVKNAWSMDNQGTDLNSLQSRIKKARIELLKWKTIQMPNSNLLKVGFARQIGDGTDTLLWSNPWLSSAHCHTPAVQFQMDLLSLRRVCDLFDSTGRDWDRELVSQTFSPKDAQLILKTHLVRGDSKDKWIWRLEKSSTFTIKSAYKAVFMTAVQIFGCLGLELLGGCASLLFLVQLLLRSGVLFLVGLFVQLSV
ncbi:ribonuclease H-like superfamily protein, partial [Striga asiatica]